MVIDMHVHPYCKEAHILPSVEVGVKRQFECKYRRNSHEAIKQRKKLFSECNAVDIIAKMDDAGIDLAVIVAFDMTTQYGVIMVTNEDVSRLAISYPARFIPFASVDPSLGKQAIDQLEYAVKKLNCKGLKLCPPVQKFDFSDPKFHPLWEAALEMDIIVWTHTSHQLGHFGSDARLGHPMLIEPVALKYPELKVVLGHCGFPWVWEAWSLVVRHANVYIDISAYTSLYNHFPWDAYSKFSAENKVLFASDYPVREWKESLAALDSVGLTKDFKTKILGENAQKLLDLS
jgi:predicted TIM-barrel fold metal-dependent hydrolase